MCLCGLLYVLGALCGLREGYDSKSAAVYVYAGVRAAGCVIAGQKPRQF